MRVEVITQYGTLAFQRCINECIEKIEKQDKKVIDIKTMDHIETRGSNFVTLTAVVMYE